MCVRMCVCALVYFHSDSPDRCGVDVVGLVWGVLCGCVYARVQFHRDSPERVCVDIACGWCIFVLCVDASVCLCAGMHIQTHIHAHIHTHTQTHTHA